MSHGFDSSSRPTRRALAAAVSLLVAAALVVVPGSVASAKSKDFDFQVKRATFVSSSTVVIDAKITCPDEFVGLSVYVRLKQSTGGSSAVGDASSPPLECTGTPQKYTVAVQNFSDTAFVQGSASVTQVAYYCDDDKSCYYLSSGPEVVRVR